MAQAAMQPGVLVIFIVAYFLVMRLFGFRFLDFVRPVSRIMPRVSPPDREVSHNEKFRWTIAVLLIFLVCSQLPLFGVMSSADPLYWMRLILAFKRGTLMELGIMPIVASAMIMNTLLYARLIAVDGTLRERQAVLDTAQKIIAFTIALGQATVYVKSGIYGYPENLGTGICFFIIFQLVGTSVIVIFLDEICAKGYGFDSAINIFVAANTCEFIFWHAFSPITINYLRFRDGELDGVVVPEFEGAIIALFHFLYIWPDKGRALREAFWRDGLPNMMSLVSTVIILTIATYFLGYRIEIPVKSKRFRGQRGIYPIWLLDTNTPVLLQSATASNILALSRTLATYYPNNRLVNTLGIWEPGEGPLPFRAISGIAYYMSTPRTIKEAVLEPIHTSIYAIFVVSICMVWSRILIELYDSARATAESLEESQLIIVSHHKISMQEQLKRIMVPGAMLGGGIFGLLFVAADISGAIGGGVGIISATALISHYYRRLYN